MKSDKLVSAGTGLTDYFLGSAQLPPLSTVITLTAASAYKYVSQLKEHKFMTRLQRFFTETHKTTDKERLEFLDRLGSDQRDFWDRTLLILEKIDEEQKANMIGKLCHALILKRITTEQYHRASLAIERSYAFDLHYFYESFKGYLQTHPLQPSEDNRSSTIADGLVLNGLMTASSGQNGHLPTDLGLIIFYHCLK